MSTHSVSIMNNLLPHREGNRGAALVEFAIVLPFVALLLFAGIEGARAFRYAQQISHVSREAANDAFRNCWHLVDNLSTPQNEVSQCLQDALSLYQNDLQSLLPGVEVITKKWSCTPVGIPLDELLPTLNPIGVLMGSVAADVNIQSRQLPPSTQVTEEGVGSSPPNSVGRLSPADFQGANPNDNYLGIACANQRSIITAEVLLPYSPLLTFVARMYSFKNGRLYAIAIF